MAQQPEKLSMIEKDVWRRVSEARASLSSQYSQGERVEHYSKALREQLRWTMSWLSIRRVLDIVVDAVESMRTDAEQEARAHKVREQAALIPGIPYELGGGDDEDDEPPPPPREAVTFEVEDIVPAKAEARDPDELADDQCADCEQVRPLFLAPDSESTWVCKECLSNVE